MTIKFPSYSNRQVQQHTRHKINIEDLNHVLFTIGYEKKSIEQYLEELKLNNVHVLIDIRANPVSRKPGFSKNKLKWNCESKGVLYFHFPEAGIPSIYRRELNSPVQVVELFDWYKSNLESIPETIQHSVDLVNSYFRVALTCFERDVNLCHRKIFAEYIKNKFDSAYLEIIHL